MRKQARLMSVFMWCGLSLIAGTCLANGGGLWGSSTAGCASLAGTYNVQAGGGPSLSTTTDLRYYTKRVNCRKSRKNTATSGPGTHTFTNTTLVNISAVSIYDIGDQIPGLNMADVKSVALKPKKAGGGEIFTGHGGWSCFPVICSSTACVGAPVTTRSVTLA